VDEAFHLVFNLYRNTHLPIAIRGACCSLLATGKGDCIRFAHESVSIYKEMLELNKDNTTIKSYLVEAEEPLAETYRDTLDNSQSGSQAIYV